MWAIVSDSNSIGPDGRIKSYGFLFRRMVWPTLTVSSVLKRA